MLPKWPFFRQDKSLSLVVVAFLISHAARGTSNANAKGHLASFFFYSEIAIIPGYKHPNVNVEEPGFEFDIKAANLDFSRTCIYLMVMIPEPSYNPLGLGLTQSQQSQ